MSKRLKERDPELDEWMKIVATAQQWGWHSSQVKELERPRILRARLDNLYGAYCEQRAQWEELEKERATNGPRYAFAYPFTSRKLST